MKEQSRKIALCGVSCALAVTIMLLGGILPLATFCGPMLAMVVLLPVRQECGTRMASAAYGAAAILALLLVADREAALIFVFFGWYPLVQPRILALRSRLLRLAAKLLFCNLAIALVYGILLFLFQLGDGMTEACLCNAQFFGCFSVMLRPGKNRKITKLIQIHENSFPKAVE